MTDFLTLGAAARRSGIPAKALSKAIHDGRLAARRRDNWVFEIEAGELARFVSGEAAGTPAPVVSAPAPVVTTPVPAIAQTTISASRPASAPRRSGLLRWLFPERATA